MAVATALQSDDRGERGRWGSSLVARVEPPLCEADHREFARRLHEEQRARVRASLLVIPDGTEAES